MPICQRAVVRLIARGVDMDFLAADDDMIPAREWVVGQNQVKQVEVVRHHQVGARGGQVSQS